MKCSAKTKKKIDSLNPFFRSLVPPVLRQPVRLVIICFLVALGSVTSVTRPADANRALPTDLSYSTETTWLLPSLPDLSATSGYIPHNFSQGEAIFQAGDEVIHGFRPGKSYPALNIRNIAWGLETAQYYYPDEYLREPIEAYLRRQHGAHTSGFDADFDVVAGVGAIGGIITPTGDSTKQTVTTDEETSLIHAAYLYYNITYNTDWLQSLINGRPVIERLNLAASWLYTHRLDPSLHLLWRTHSTDWGNIKLESDHSFDDYDLTQDHLTVSLYDQALAYMALLELAEMNAAVGETAHADEWQNKAEALKKKTNALLWQADRGFYLTHTHITPLRHDIDESTMVSISNALAVYVGMTDFRQNKVIFQNLEQTRLAAGANKPGLSIYPYYPNLFIKYPDMEPGTHQNGGIWDWWGGVQIKAEFLTGFSQSARTHLLQVANEWQKHPGNIVEWQSTSNPGQEGSHYYSAAAGTMGSAIIAGFFGVELNGGGLTLQPRLGLNDGYIRVYQAATDRYAAYRYDWDQDAIKVDYGTNTKGTVTIKVLKLRSEHIDRVIIDGQPVEFETEIIGHDSYTVLTGPSGQHSLEIIKGHSVTKEPTSETPSVNSEIVSSNSKFPTPSIAPNLASPSQTIAEQQIVSVDTASDKAITAAETMSNRYGHETQPALIQFAGVVLIIVICLILTVFAVIRRFSGLS
jgi:hypothetical protein